MTVWKSFGASVIGPSHITDGRPNQDAWLGFHHTWGDGIVVSDGLGSKRLSDLGSKAACRSVLQAARSHSEQEKVTIDGLLDQIKQNWLSAVAPNDSNDCAATCLFSIDIGDGYIHMGMLGDGLVATIKNEGDIVLLSDNKEEGFSNVTDALSLGVLSQAWRCQSILKSDCKAILLCSDGVADDLDDIKGFVCEFVEAHRGLSSVTASRHVRSMLENWPTPMHSDDKTIACLFLEEVSDG